MARIVVYLKKASASSTKKYTAVIMIDDVKKKTVHFGAKGYQDYTMHKDYDRMRRYVSRHKKEDWTKKGIYKAGFWSRWILWNKPTLTASIAATEKKFNIKIRRTTKSR